MQIRNFSIKVFQSIIKFFYTLFSIFTMNCYKQKYHYMYSHRYMKYNEFKSFVDLLKNVKFHQKSSRDEIMEFLSTIVTFEISQNSIAPDYPFFDLDDNYISKLITLIRSSIDLPDRHFEKNTQLVSENFSSISDAKTSFINHVHKLAKLFFIEPKKGLIFGLYTKETFENRYDLSVKNSDDNDSICDGSCRDSGVER